MKYILFTFKNTKSAMLACQLLEETAVVMPVLREISSDCGIALKISQENYEKSKIIINNSIDKDFFSIYEIDGFGNSKTIKIIQ